MPTNVDPVIAECLRLSEIHDLDEKYRGWLALWQDHLEGVDIATVSVEHVEAITWQGYEIAIQSEKFDEAIRYLNIYYLFQGGVEYIGYGAQQGLRPRLVLSVPSNAICF